MVSGALCRNTASCVVGRLAGLRVYLSHHLLIDVVVQASEMFIQTVSDHQLYVQESKLKIQLKTNEVCFLGKVAFKDHHPQR